ncbi:hypothetical protein PTE30175_02007 [Pandoraea terrae]|uniref:Transcriptional regulator n=1 Tax=Pandoraea terrae TaxID=1537710 RepID=A0A5E4UKI8_9BURK|nr:helix-turn-helix transcriptional regulator [Pandoraea terrae]VVE00063.1 hypothetical protein PTE30175_02007 [Pandoraea terrae]
MNNIFQASLTAADFGEAFRNERRKLKKSQAWVAEQAGIRRETVVQLEQGQNVGLHVIMRALGAIGKGLMIASDRPDYDMVRKMIRDE